MKKSVGPMAKMALAAGLSLALVAGLSGCVTGGSSASDTGKSQKGQAAQAEQSTQDASEELDLSFSKRDLDYSYDESSATKIQLADGAISIEGDGAAADGSTLTLSADGTYIVSGSLADGEIVVAAGDEDKLQVVFDGVSVTNSDGPAFFVDNADKVFITLAEGTQNSLADGATYSLDGDDDNRDGAIFSRDDLTINGTGELTVTGNYQHAIVSKDDLVIAGPTMDVTAKEDAMQGDDCIKVAEGAITVNAGDDGLKSDTVVYVKDGTIDVQSCVEGYEAEKIIVDGGTHTIIASDDALNAALQTETSGAANTAFGDTPSGSEPPSAPSDGEMPEAPSGDMPGQAGGHHNDDHSGYHNGGSTGATTAVAFEQQGNAASGNGFGQKGNGAPGGKGMRDGSGMPDGSTAPDGQQMPDGSTNGSAPSFDNGMQGGKMGGFGGGGGMAQSSDTCLIQINGGTLTLSGGADGIDSNGNVEINGGVVLVCGPNSGMDGSLDYDLSAQVNGGTVLMTGSVGSTKGLDQSEQAWTVASVQGSKGSNVALLDANGNELASLTATQAFASVFASSPQIANGSAFTIEVDGTPTSLTM